MAVSLVHVFEGKFSDVYKVETVYDPVLGIPLLEIFTTGTCMNTDVH